MFMDETICLLASSVSVGAVSFGYAIIFCFHEDIFVIDGPNITLVIKIVTMFNWIIMCSNDSRACTTLLLKTSIVCWKVLLCDHKNILLLFSW